eukprot:4880150-Pyramimonas_sp.AAC.1
MRKKTPPGWVNELPWKDTKDTKSSKQQKDTEGTEFAYGFRKDLLLAYRAPTVSYTHLRAHETGAYL